MSHIETKAHQLMQEAEKKLSSGGFFRNLFTKSSERIEESIEYYMRAANLFKMSKNWSQAGHAFEDAADQCLRNNNEAEAAINYVEAAVCFKKCDMVKAIDLYTKAIELYQEKGKFLMAAKIHQNIAELMEDDYDLNEAIQHYEKAADLFKQECNFSSANKCLVKVAEYAALEKDYDKALNIFQEIACFDLASSLMKYSAKQYLFRAAICLLCTDTDFIPKLQTYIDMYPAFENSREYQLIVTLMESIYKGDEESFTEAIRKFDTSCSLSQWHVTMLLRVKNQRMCNRIDLK
ncbi:unnamed protein product [Acanthoscelides obtectus]|uniref:Alpha-soluble NSF attachment protein n=2 Tax=Acanthoscelides obtectus TaxID=200917 RepID=A0A9P0LK88_ACAOB|nr:unnamed protein product [Acanthoscelides obtectus]CAK1630164.1 Alpha-soluble NSF attachment protein [Acanthoscelides obtectus]